MKEKRSSRHLIRKKSSFHHRRVKVQLYISHTSGKNDLHRLSVRREGRQKRPEGSVGGSKEFRAWLRSIMHLNSFKDIIERRSSRLVRQSSAQCLSQMRRWKRRCKQSNRLLFLTDKCKKRGAQYSIQDLTKALYNRISCSLDKKVLMFALRTDVRMMF